MNRLVLGGVLALLVLGAGDAAADRKAAEAHFRAGARAYAAQSFEAAAASFDLAYQAEPLPEIAFSGAQAYRRLYRTDARLPYVRRAIELYKAYLAAVKRGGRVGDAADNLGEMERELERLRAAGAGGGGELGPRTRLGVSVSLADERGAEAGALREIGDATGEATRGLVATLDGAPLEPFALAEVPAGEHRIVVKAEGYATVEKRAVAIDGQSALLDIELQPVPAAVTVRTEAGARISVDGRRVATAPAAPLVLPAGPHLITVLRRGRAPFARELVVGRGAQITLAAPLTPTGQRRAVPWVYATAGVLTGLAITTGIGASIADGDAADLRAQIAAGDRAPGDADRYDAAVARRDDRVLATWILGGAALTAGVVATGLLVFDEPRAEGPRGAPSAAPTIAPLVGSTTGVAFSGTF